MINAQNHAMYCPSNAVDTFNIPVLDNEFDPGEDDIFEQDDVLHSYSRHHEIEEIQL